jgi:hypothetical protein
MTILKSNYFGIVALVVILAYIMFSPINFFPNYPYLGRALLAAGIILITYCNMWLGILAVILILVMKQTDSFININQLFDEQNHLQKKVYYVPKKRHEPVPQNDTDFVPLNPMQPNAIQSSQPAKIPVLNLVSNQKTSNINKYSNLLRIENAVRPKSSKTIGSNMGIQTGLNKDYEPESNWPDGNAFKNPYSAAEE